MYKNIEVLNKEKFKAMKFADIKANEVAKNIGIIPLGFTEVIDMSAYAPVIIMGKEEAEFVAFTGISKEVNIFRNNNVYIPTFPKTYPFLNTNVQDQNGNLKSVVSIDNGKSVSKKKKFFIFNKDGELQEKTADKIKLLKELTRQREVSKNIIKELKSHDLLIEKDFKVKYKDGEKVLLESFYVINRDALIKLSDEILSKWAKKGWMSIIDCHINSLKRFEKVLASIK